MPIKHLIQGVTTTAINQLETLVENRRIFNLVNCELNIFETHQSSYHIPLSFNELIVTSMVRGKKVMHLSDKPSFDYLPGETVILPPHETMIIDFPEATLADPTQCIALAINEEYIKDTLIYLNSFHKSQDEHKQWKLQFNQYHFQHNNEISDLISKLIRVCQSKDTAKNIFADLTLKELLIRLLQSQYLEQVSLEASQATDTNSHRANFVLSYIQDHLTEKIAIDALSRKAYLSRNIFFKWFREQFGITPVEYINRERIRMAKQLLVNSAMSIQEVSDYCGFSDANYFIRVFRKMEGITPKTYQMHCRM
ncbi:AraC family transcriptional regulator [Chitinophaga sp. Cy-1792]|uniref:helix-turn-helix transcriptional regulator n=1 Tax=Chitinophaga sp. Cy-1792 TaxID=2608339 RepID=UPI00142007E3|nr:AraC family transcriptional regulator [Chitinophaga sp. Cy-1792]NIG55599.1 AraC family transcriptional regulator [Chitinophaga sp. Cy-1792]